MGNLSQNQDSFAQQEFNKAFITIPTTVQTRIPIDVPKGWKIHEVGRYPMCDERYILYVETYKRWTDTLRMGDYHHDYPPSHYVILTPATRKVEEVTFTPTGEVRCPKRGEWYQYNEGQFYRAGFDYSDWVGPIVLRTTRTIQIPA